MIRHNEKTSLKHQNHLKKQSTFFLLEEQCYLFPSKCAAEANSFSLTEQQNVGSAENNRCIAKRTGW